MKTVTLDLSRQLKANGYPQEGYCWYRKVREHDSYRFYDTPWDGTCWDEAYSPTADEILEQLPEGLFVRKKSGKWFGCRYHDEVKMLSVFTKADTPADAAAKMWLDLKGQSLLKEER